MKVELTNITTQYLQEWELTKKIDNDFLVEEIQSKLKITNRNDFDYLLDSTVNGLDKEDGTLTINCGDEEITKDVHIRHNEGNFNLKNCMFEKPLRLSNSLDCIIDETINIFDYTATITNTIQGTAERDTDFIIGMLSLQPDQNIDFDMIYGVTGGIPDRTSEGYFPEYILLRVYPLFYNEYDADLDEYIDKYQGHEIQLQIVYVRIKSATQFNYLWRPIPSTSDYYYSAIDGVILQNPFRSLQGVYTGQQFWDYYQVFECEAGKLGKYIDRDISNTYRINEILTDLFSCTGLPLISNFFGINADGTNPNNSHYEYALAYCQDVKICQSFDIIRESAIQDSFAQSGLIKVKELLNNLLICFNLVIVPGETEIRLEHKSYFINKGVDYQNPEHPLDYEIGDFEINKEQIDGETFSFAQPTPTKDFWQCKIDYNKVGLYKRENRTEIQCEKILTDVFGTINDENFNKSEFEDLFFLLSTYNDEIIGLNSQFGMVNLVNELHLILRPSKNGTVNGVSTVFNTYSIGLENTVKIKGTIKRFNKINPYTVLKLKEGTFMISEMTFSDKKDLTMKVIK